MKRLGICLLVLVIVFSVFFVSPIFAHEEEGVTPIYSYEWYPKVNGKHHPTWCYVFITDFVDDFGFVWPNMQIRNNIEHTMSGNKCTKSIFGLIPYSCGYTK